MDLHNVWMTCKPASNRTLITLRKKPEFVNDLGSFVAVKKELTKTTDVIEEITLSSDSEAEDGRNSLTNLQNAFQNQDIDLNCAICNLPNENSVQCSNCSQNVHIEDCSVANGVTARICTACYCLLCKKVFDHGHICECHICMLPTNASEDVICYRCERLSHRKNCVQHIRAPEKNNEFRFICSSCFYSRAVNLSVSAKSQLLGKVMLTDEHIVRSSIILSAQFGSKVGGLCAPMDVSRGKAIKDIKYYPHHQNGTPGVQILNTGNEHWVTAIFLKDTNVKLLDSLRSIAITGHVKLQVAMISHTSDKIMLSRPPCAQQTNSVDCGFYAIANATEFCFTSEIQHVDFNYNEFRPHLLKCIESGKLTPFPRFSKRAKKVREHDEDEVLTTYCVCHLPDNYGNMVGCDECDEWFHRECVGFASKDRKAKWFCEKCAVKGKD